MTGDGLPLIVEPHELQAALDHDRLLIVDLSPSNVHHRTHIPGAVHLDYSRIVTAKPPVTGLLPDTASLTELFTALGLSVTTHVVAYDSEGGGKASRLLWTLAAAGHRHFSLLNGGLNAWRHEGLPVDNQPAVRAAQPYTINLNDTVSADKNYILTHLHDPDTRIVDCRSPAEYAGQDLRAQRGGHIPGAVNVEWTRALDPARQMRLKDQTELRALYEQADVRPDKQVIVYCQTHHRSALSYVVLKSLGYEVRGYPGSWSEWGNDTETPVEQ